uniref:uncharacterized protein LOC122594983 n=1 Tax=Erigeron canadensis TaxID=72917 RepID=UPI001CB90400|nr:uncharacterized protein LOC122594983 [Erigeron canadensis]
METNKERREQLQQEQQQKQIKEAKNKKQDEKEDPIINVIRESIVTSTKEANQPDDILAFSRSVNNVDSSLE